MSFSRAWPSHHWKTTWAEQTVQTAPPFHILSCCLFRIRLVQPLYWNKPGSSLVTLYSRPSRITAATEKPGVWLWLSFTSPNTEPILKQSCHSFQAQNQKEYQVLLETRATKCHLNAWKMKFQIIYQRAVLVTVMQVKCGTINSQWLDLWSHMPYSCVVNILCCHWRVIISNGMEDGSNTRCRTSNSPEEDGAGALPQTEKVQNRFILFYF